jgi:hypothetical protein
MTSLFRQADEWIMDEEKDWGQFSENEWDIWHMGHMGT